MPSEPTPRALAGALRRLLRPLVRVLLRNGVSFADFAEHAKKVYVDVATRDFAVRGRKPSISRTAILTGLTRKDVSRLAKLADEDLDAASERYNRAARVLSGWVRDARFRAADGAPAALAPEAGGAGEASFAELVRRHGGDVPSRAVLDELLRVGAVEPRADGRLELVARAYVPARDADEKLAILGADVAELIATIDHNITQPPERARFQRKVSYDGLPPEFLPELRARVREQAQALLEDLDREMAAHDRDEQAGGDAGAPRRLASIGIYYFDDDPDDLADGSAESLDADRSPQEE